MKPKWHAKWRVYLGLRLELKESIHILPEEESCNDLSLLNSLILTAFSLALVNIKVLLGECSLYWHKETHTLFPLTNMVVCHLGTLDLILKGALHNLSHLSFIWQIGKTKDICGAWALFLALTTVGHSLHWSQQSTKYFLKAYSPWQQHLPNVCIDELLVEFLCQVAWLLITNMEYTSHRVCTRRTWKACPKEELCSLLLPICLTKPDDAQQMTRFLKCTSGVVQEKTDCNGKMDYRGEYSMPPTCQNWISS